VTASFTLAADKLGDKDFYICAFFAGTSNGDIVVIDKVSLTYTPVYNGIQDGGFESGGNKYWTQAALAGGAASSTTKGIITQSNYAYEGKYAAVFSDTGKGNTARTTCLKQTNAITAAGSYRLTAQIGRVGTGGDQISYAIYLPGDSKLISSAVCGTNFAGQCTTKARNGMTVYATVAVSFVVADGKVGDGSLYVCGTYSGTSNGDWIIIDAVDVDAA